MSSSLSRSGVDGALDSDALVELLVEPDEHEPEHRGRDDGDDGRSAVDRHGDRVAGLHPIGVHVAGVDARGVGYRVDKGQSGGSLCWRTRDCIAYP